MTNDDKNKKIETIRALLNKTTKNGASEDEMFQSISLAKKMMAKYSITLEDIKNKNVSPSDFIVGCPKDTKITTKLERAIATSIALYTNTKTFTYSFAKHDRRIVFFGHKVDVELALYIREVCMNTAKHLWAVYKSSKNIENISKHKDSYIMGMATRIAERLEDMYGNDVKEEQSTTGNSLIVVKNQLVVSLFENLKAKSKINFKSGQVIKWDNIAESEQAGYEDGDKIALAKQTKHEKHLSLEHKK